jgi:PAS domain S-box-containing protein
MISILFVDDNPSSLTMCRHYLNKTGDLIVDTAESPIIALEKLTLTRYDAIVSDFQMPGMDGIEFLRQVRDRFSNVPFIIFTGKGREEVVIEAFESGADSYLQKGGDSFVEFAELAHKIRRAVELRRNQQLLKESEERYRTITESAIDLIYILDRDGNNLYGNPSCLHALRCSYEEFLQKNQEDFFPPEIAERHIKAIRQVFDTGIPLTLEEKIPIPDGDYLSVTSLTPLHNSEGAITSVMGISRTISSGEQTDDARWYLNEHYAKILETTPDGFFMTDSMATLVDVNDNYCSMTGYHKQELLGRPVSTLEANESKEEFEEHRKLIIERGFDRFETRHKRKDGEAIDVVINISYHPGTKRQIAFVREIKR